MRVSERGREGGGERGKDRGQERKEIYIYKERETKREGEKGRGRRGRENITRVAPI